LNDCAVLARDLLDLYLGPNTTTLGAQWKDINFFFLLLSKKTLTKLFQFPKKQKYSKQKVNQTLLL